MIIEPTPTSPRSTIRRVLRLAGLVLPVVLLGAVIGVGVLGPRPDPPPSSSPIAALPSAPPGTSAPSASAPLVAVNLTDPVPPSAFEDLSVADVADVLGEQSGAQRGAAIAVSGFLHVDSSADLVCAGEPGGSVGPWCERLGVLAARPWPSTSSPTARSRAPLRLPPHLRLSIPVGVRLPQAVEDAHEKAQGDVTRVLVVGRFAPTVSGCGRLSRGCGKAFVVERFAWADGLRVALTPLIADPLQTGTKRANPFEAVLRERELPLAAVLTWPDGIARLDPDAAALAAAGPPSEPVWYVRVLEDAGDPGGDRLVRWMLLADRDFGVIGSGRVPATTADAARPGSG